LVTLVIIVYVITSYVTSVTLPLNLTIIINGDDTDTDNDDGSTTVSIVP
jgi:hypothetical protein